MILGEQVGLFRLSFEGREALRGLVPDSGSFEAFVVEEDKNGLWIYMPEEQVKSGSQPGPVMLLKWEYLATITLLPSGTR